MKKQVLGFWLVIVLLVTTSIVPTFQGNFVKGNTLLWFEDFEGYSVGSFPSTWIQSGNTNSYVDNSEAYTGSKSLKLKGSYGGCWEAIAYRNMETTPQIGRTIVIEFDIKTTNYGSPGCHGYGGVHLKTGANWRYNGRELLRFKQDGKVHAYDLTWPYTINQWHHIKIEYTIRDDGTVKIKYWFDGDYKGYVIDNARDFENSMKYLGLESGDTVTWFDNIRISYKNDSTLNNDNNEQNVDNPTNNRISRSQEFSVIMDGTNDQDSFNFEIPENTQEIKVMLYMSSDSSIDFDLSVVDPRGRRTGGWTLSDHRELHGIPNSEYSGFTQKPESIVIKNPPAGTWKIIVYSYRGSGEAIIKITTTLLENTQHVEDRQCDVIWISSDKLYGLEDDTPYLLCISKKDKLIQGEVIKIVLTKNSRGRYYIMTLPLFRFKYLHGEYESTYYRNYHDITIHTLEVGYEGIHQILSNSVSYDVPDVTVDIIGEVTKIFVPTGEQAINALTSFYDAIRNIESTSQDAKVTIGVFNEIFKRILLYSEYSVISGMVQNCLNQITQDLRYRDLTTEEFLKILKRKLSMVPTKNTTDAKVEEVEFELSPGYSATQYIELPSNVDIRIELIWENNADFDLHVYTPSHVHLVGYNGGKVYNNYPGYTTYEGMKIRHKDATENKQLPEIVEISNVQEGIWTIKVIPYRGTSKAKLHIYIYKN